MRYFAQYNEASMLLGIGKGYGGVEISESEYMALAAEIREKSLIFNRVITGEITILDVPEKWREEIKARVDAAMKDQFGNDEEQISAEEALNIIMGGEK